MKKTMMVFLILAASAAGVCFAGDNNTGNPPNPPVAGQGGPNTMDNSDRNTNSSNNY
jgi:hypothetical protein